MLHALDLPVSLSLEWGAQPQSKTTQPLQPLSSRAWPWGWRIRRTPGQLGTRRGAALLLSWLCGSQGVLGRALLPLPWLLLCLGTGSSWRRVLAATIHWYPGRFGRNFPTLVKAVLVPVELLLCPLLPLLSVLVRSCISHLAALVVCHSCCSPLGFEGLLGAKTLLALTSLP